MSQCSAIEGNVSRLQARLSHFVGHLPALKVPILRDAVRKHLVSLSLESLSVLLSQALLPEYFEEALRRLAKTSTFDEAKETMDKAFFPFRLDFTVDQINRILEVYPQNNQLYNSFRAQTLIEKLFQQSEQFLLETKDAWIHLYEQRCILVGERLGHVEEWPLLTSIERRYPDAITLATGHLQERYAQIDWEGRTDF